MRTNIVRAFLMLIAAVAGLTLASGRVHAENLRLLTETAFANWTTSDSKQPIQFVGACEAATDGCDAGCTDGCSRAGWVGSSELLFLKVFSSEGDLAGVPDYNYRTGYRGSVGYQRYDGLGFRVRFFDYFQRVDAGDRVDISQLDGEVYDSLVNNESWYVSVGGGIRYLDYFEGESPLPEEGTSLTGVGPVLTGEIQRHLNERLSVYAITRASIVVGNSVQFFGQVPDTTAQLYEIQVGGQWSRPWRSALLFGRIGWEAQYYHGISETDTEDIALMGGVLAAGIIR